MLFESQLIILFVFLVCETKSPSMSDFLTGLENSGWLRHIKAVMDASVFLAKVNLYTKLQLKNLWLEHIKSVAQLTPSRFPHGTRGNATGIERESFVLMQSVGLSGLFGNPAHDRGFETR